MKNITKKIILIFICILAVITNVDAAKVTSAYDSHDHGITYYDTPKGNGGYATIVVGEGADAVTAYCMDPGAAPVSVGNSCREEVKTGTAFAEQAAYIMSHGGSTEAIGLAMRIIAVGTGEANVRGKESTGYKKDNYCTYKTVVDKASYISGTTPTYSDGFKDKYSSYNCEGYGFKTKKDAEGNDYGKDAIELAASAMEASSAGSNSTSNPVLKETSNKDGSVTISYSEVAEGSTLKIECSSCNENGQNQIVGSSGTVTLTATDPSASSCGTYRVSVSSSGAVAGACSTVVQYTCGGSSSGNVQKFVGCKDTYDESGSGSKELSGEIKCNDSSTCTKDPTATIKTGADAEALCDQYGNTFIQVLEKSEYETSNDDIDNCVLGNSELDASQAILANRYCQIYCTEDYEFYSPGGLTNLDYDPATDKWYIASGSYFNFEYPFIEDITNISCYSVNNVNLLIDDIVVKAENTVVDAMTKYEYTCRTETDPDTGEVTEIQGTRTTYYKAVPNYSSLSISIEEAGTSYTEEEVSSCRTGVETKGNVDSAKATYKSQADDLITEFEKCNNWDLSNLKADLESTCAPTVQFKYSDGAWLGITDPALTLDKTGTVEGSIVGNYDCNGSGYCETSASSSSKVNLGLGLNSNNFMASEYTELNGTIKNKYSLKTVAICNDYNTHTATYCIPGTADYSSCVSSCTAENGKVLTEGWPTAADHTHSDSHYEFIVEKYGHDFTGGTCTPGRLEEIAKEEGYDESNLECPYDVNNCGDCDWHCDPDGICEGDPECDEECIWACKEIGCMFDVNNGLAINYSLISLQNPFNLAYLRNQHQSALAMVSANTENNVVAATTPNKNGLAANWSNAKGTYTLEQISEEKGGKGETIYSEEPEYSITLTPDLINDIRAYNDAQERGDAGGYLDASLRCHGNGGSDVHIVCESTFLDAYGVVDNSSWESYDGKPGYTGIKKSGIGPAWK